MTNLAGWQAVAREIGDYYLDKSGCDGCYAHMGHDKYADSVGDWLPAEAAAKEILRLRQSKDAAYTERDRLVQALSKLFPSYLCRHPESDEQWDADWRWIVVVQLPTGQASWHIHDSERGWFDHLEVRSNQWDGHSTEEKYARLSRLPVRDEGEILRLRERLAELTSSLHEVAQNLQNGMDTIPNSSCDIFATLLYMHGLWMGRDLAAAEGQQETDQ